MTACHWAELAAKLNKTESAVVNRFHKIKERNQSIEREEEARRRAAQEETNHVSRVYPQLNLNLPEILPIAGN